MDLSKNYLPNRNTVESGPCRANYLTTKQAAVYLGVSRQFLEIARLKGHGPRFCKPECSRLVRYYVPDLDAWMREPLNTEVSNA